MSTKSKKWEVINKSSLLKKPPWFEIYLESLRLPNGDIVQEYYGIYMPHYTAVFAVTDDKKIMIMRCYRHAIGEVTLTVPGGMLEKGETPLSGIQREFLEETGYVAHNWKNLGKYIGNSTRGCGTYHLFFATGAKKKMEANSGDLEEMELLLWTQEEVEKAIDSGQTQSLSLISILLLGLRCLKS